MRYSARKQLLRRLQTRAEIVFYRSSETKKTARKRLKRHFETPLFPLSHGMPHPIPGMVASTSAPSRSCPRRRCPNPCAPRGRRTRTIACVTRKRDHVRAGRIMKTEVETTCLITSLDAPRPATLVRPGRRALAHRGHAPRQGCLPWRGWRHKPQGPRPEKCLHLGQCRKTIAETHQYLTDKSYRNAPE